MPRIFISYRREDASAYAGRLFDRLITQYGRENVFMDIDSIEPGADFGEVIEHTVASCDVFIAVMGKQWLETRDAEGIRRLDNPDDFVRLEVTSALGRKIRVIPLLVGNARMPRSDDLPEAVRPLARRNAFEVSDIGFHENVGRLIQVLDRIDQPNPDQRSQPAAAAKADSAPATAPARIEVPKEPAPVVMPRPFPPTPTIYPPAFTPGPVPPPPRPFPASQYYVAPARRPALAIALLAHLFFGFGLFYVDPKLKRKIIYPISIGYVFLDSFMAAQRVEPFHSEEFGATTFFMALGIFVLGFMDVIFTCLKRRRMSGIR